MKNQTKGILALFILAFVFSTFGVFNRYLSQTFSPFQVQYLRVFVALLLTFFIFFKNLNFKKIITLPKKEWLILAIRGVGFYAFAGALNIESFNLTTYSNVSFLQAIPTTALLAMLFLQEKVTIKKVAIIFLAFIGVLFISSTDLTHAFVWGKGAILALIADLLFSLLYISRRWHSNILNNQEITFMIFVFGFITLFISSLFFFDKNLPITGWSMTYLFVIMLSAVFMVANQFLVNYGFQYVEPFLANNILALESIFALCIGFFLYKEFPSFQALLGSAFILLSVPLMGKAEEKT